MVAGPPTLLIGCQGPLPRTATATTATNTTQTNTKPTVPPTASPKLPRIQQRLGQQYSTPISQTVARKDVRVSPPSWVTPSATGQDGRSRSR